MRRLLTLTVGALLLLAAPAGYPLGFGEIQLQSALNQPLKAQIPLLAVRSNERDQVSVEMASPDTFKRFGIERPGILDQIDVRIAKGSAANSLQVLVSSRVPIQEPFLTFLVEANWPGGRAIREFTVLLDPPVSLATTQSQVELPPPSAASAPPQPRPQLQRPQAPAASAPIESAPAATPDSPAPDDARAQTYGPVAAGETLWAIGRKVEPEREYTIYQTMLAIYLANLGAFDKNLNLLRRGAVLKIPSKASIAAVNPTVAKAEVMDQKRAFLAARENALQNKAIQSAVSNNLGAKVRLEPASDHSGETSQPENSDAEGNDTAPGDALDALVKNSRVGQPGAAAQSGPSSVTRESGSLSGAELTAGNPTVPAASADAENDAPASASSTPGEVAQAVPGSIVATEDQPQTDSAPAGDIVATGPDPAIASANPGTSPNSGLGVEGTPAPADTRTSPASANTDTTAPVTRGGAIAATLDDSAANPLSAQRSVAPAVFAGILTPRALLILLAGLLLVVALWMLWNRRQYKSVPADFSLDSSRDDDFDDTTEFAPPSAVATAAGVAAYSAVPRSVTPAVSGVPEGPSEEFSEAAELDDLLADADSLIENELYDEALAALEVGLDRHPGHPALQRKILEVHHAAGEREAFMHKLENYFPNVSPQDPDWRAVAAMARDFAPGDERFRTPEQPAVTDAVVAPPEPADEPAPWQPAESSSGTANDLTVSDTEMSEFDSFSFEDDGMTRPAAAFERGPWDRDSSTFGEFETADDLPKADSAPTAQAPQTPRAEELSSDFDLSDFDTDFTPKGEEVPPASRPQAATDSDFVPETVEFDISEFELTDEGQGGADDALFRGSDEPVSAASATDLEWPQDDTAASGPDSLQQSIEIDQPDLPAAQDSADDRRVNDDSASLALESTHDRVPLANTDPQLINDDFGDDDLDADDEVVTKLDLARAYIDMGEPEMAASLLQEVTSEGSAEQQQEAELLLARTG